jgi:glyoxylase-like metal-dependent hydrolase (beta-lactamase superfamily II)
MLSNALVRDSGAQACGLPPGVSVVERGWLSSNMVLMQGPAELVVVDTGYASHAEQTLAIVEAALARHPLGRGASVRVLNTHLHSDHCGGNAAIQARYPSAHIMVPQASWEAVGQWLPLEQAIASTGQRCQRFVATSALHPRSQMLWGLNQWDVLAAPGHDPHSVVLFEPQSRTLISADALWQDGFGVVFPELDGDSAFDEVADTLDLIESLGAQWVIPGHGGVFSDVTDALARARSKLAFFRQNPKRHAVHAAKVLMAFKAMEWNEFTSEQVHAWSHNTWLMRQIFERFEAGSFSAWVQDLCSSFEKNRRWVKTADGGLSVAP